MNQAARRILKTQKSLISQNLYLEDSVLDDLEQENILNETMVCKIKAERTNDDKITELLFILNKRGPRAFKVFVDAVRKHSDFLSEKLEQLYYEELDKEEAFIKAQEEGQTEALNETNSRSSGSTSSDTQDAKAQDSVTNEATQTDHLDLPMRSEYSGRLSAKGDNSFIVQQQLNSLHTKLKSHLVISSIREHSFASPKPATFQMIDELIDELLSIIDKCYRILRDAHKKLPLPEHIRKMVEKVKDLKKSLNTSEETRNKYADNIAKYQNKCRDKDQEIRRLTDENEKMKCDLNVLKEKQEKLEHLLNQSEAKERDLQSKLENISQQLEQQSSDHGRLQQEYDWCMRELNKNKKGKMFVVGSSPFGDTPYKKWKPISVERKSGPCWDNTTETNIKPQLCDHSILLHQNKTNNDVDQVRNLEDYIYPVTAQKDKCHIMTTSNTTSAYTTPNRQVTTTNTNNIRETDNDAVQKKHIYKSSGQQEKTKRGLVRPSRMTPHVSSFSSSVNVNTNASSLEIMQITNSLTTNRQSNTARSISPVRGINQRKKMSKSVSPTRKSED